MLWKISLGAGAVLLILLALLTWKLKAEVEQNAQTALVVEQLQKSLTRQQAVVDQLQTENDQLDEQFSQMLEQMTAVQEAKAESRDTVDDMRRNDETYRSWSDESLPTGVVDYERLRSSAQSHRTDTDRLQTAPQSVPLGVLQELSGGDDQ